MSLLLFALLLASCTSKPAGPLAFVTNERDGTITLIDTGSNEVVGTIKAGDGPWGIAL